MMDNIPSNIYYRVNGRTGIGRSLSFNSSMKVKHYIYLSNTMKTL